MSRSTLVSTIFLTRSARLATQLATQLAIVALAIIVASCASRVRAPVEERATVPARPAPAVTPAPAPTPEAETRPPPTYTVKRGDTLYKIALDNGLDYRELAAWNGIENVNVIREGQSLRLAAPGETAPAAPGVTTTPLRTVPPVTSGDTKPPTTSPVTPLAGPGTRNTDNYKVQPKALKEPWSEQALRDVQKSATALPPPAAPPEPAPVVVARAEPKPEAKSASVAMEDDDKPSWMWPANGKIITGVSENPNLKGIDIAGKAGQPVVASAAGKVVYAGSGIRGYGKLVIVKHNATWLSAYAHNRDILVKEGQQVAKGQSIAEMGNTDADQVMLHFEIRRHGTPVDPLKYLPPA
jgi:lipoprotein NlpD